MNMRWFSHGRAALAGAALAIGACDAASQPPAVTDQTVTIDEDTVATVPVLTGAGDPNGDPLVVTAALAPGHTVTHDDATLTIIPASDFHGSIDVRYVVSDGTYFVAGHVMVEVRPVNDAPIAEDASQQIHGPAVLLLAGSDVDGDPLGYEIVTRPSHGRLTGVPPDVDYIPDSGFTGDDEIVYRLRDAELTSLPAALHLHVSPGVGPSATSTAVTVVEDTATAVTLLGSDPDRNALTFRVLTPPAHGTLGGSGRDLVYTPAANFNGDDALTFSVDNGYSASPSATITLHVAPVNDAPVAVSQRVQAIEDIVRPIVLTGSDVEGSPLVFGIASAPRHGALSGSGPSWIYIPEPNFHGMDSFSFIAADGTATSAPATVTIDVAPVDDPPLALPLAVTAIKDTPVKVTMTGSDGDGDPLRFAIASGPLHGTLIGEPPALLYRPAAGFLGDDSFTFTVSSGGATSAPATVSIRVTAANAPATAPSFDDTSDGGDEAAADETSADDRRR